MVQFYFHSERNKHVHKNFYYFYIFPFFLELFSETIVSKSLIQNSKIPFLIIYIPYFIFKQNLMKSKQLLYLLINNQNNINNIKFVMNVNLRY